MSAPLTGDDDGGGESIDGGASGGVYGGLGRVLSAMQALEKTKASIDAATAALGLALTGKAPALIAPVYSFDAATLTLTAHGNAWLTRAAVEAEQAELQADRALVVARLAALAPLVAPLR